MKENVLLFKNHNKDIEEFTRTDKLILWPKEMKEKIITKQEQFKYEVEGINLNKKSYEPCNFVSESRQPSNYMAKYITEPQYQQENSIGNSQAKFIDFEEYEDIEKKLRKARNAFMQKNNLPANDVIARMKINATPAPRHKPIQNKFKSDFRMKHGSAEHSRQSKPKVETKPNSPQSSHGSTYKYHSTIMNPVIDVINKN